MSNQPHTFDKHQESEDRKREYSDFLGYVAANAGIMTREQLLIIWPAMCQAMMEWMVKEEKSVDLGFCILHPSPLRKNWKEMLKAQCPGMGPAMKGKSGLIQEGIFYAEMVDRRLRDPEMLCMMTDRIIGIGIEVEPKRSWWKAVIRDQLIRFMQLKKHGYAKYIGRKILNSQRKLFSTYRSFLHQISYPVGAIIKGDTGESPYISHRIPEGRIRPVAAEEYEVIPVVNLSGEEEFRRKRIVEDENARLLRLSRLQPGFTNLRKRTQLKDYIRSKRDSRGMWVLYAEEGAPEEIKSMLAERGDGRKDGVEKGTQ